MVGGGSAGARLAASRKPAAWTACIEARNLAPGTIKSYADAFPATAYPGGHLKLCAVPAGIADVLKITRLASVLDEAAAASREWEPDNVFSRTGW
jgi:hypothetical protein